MTGGGGFVCCIEFIGESCCGPGTALTVGALRGCWADLDDGASILVAHNGSQANWVQRVDVLATPAGLLVARLYAPYAKQAQPAPGTRWSPATVIGNTGPSRTPRLPEGQGVAEDGGEVGLAGRAGRGRQ